MLAIKKILFPTDFSECAEHAFDHAAGLAAAFDAEMHVFHARIRRGEEYPALAELMEDSGESTDEPLDIPVRERQGKTSRVDTTVVIQAERTGASACEAILEYAREHDIDLIVMGTHGRRGAKRLLMGSTAECVVRSATCPVLTLRADAPTMSEAGFSHILAPVDFSEYAEEAAAYTAELARRWNARVTLLHVVEEAVLPTVYGIEPVALYSIDHLLDRSRNEIESLKTKFFDTGMAVDTEIVVGHAGYSIADYAKEAGTDLIVISTHGLTGQKRFLLGSVTEQVVRSAPCAVFTVKPFGKRLIGDTTNTESALST